MKAVVAAFNQEKALVGAFSVITNLRMELFQALYYNSLGMNLVTFSSADKCHHVWGRAPRWSLSRAGNQVWRFTITEKAPRPKASSWWKAGWLVLSPRWRLLQLLALTPVTRHANTPQSAACRHTAVTLLRLVSHCGQTCRYYFRLWAMFPTMDRKTQRASGAGKW